MPVRSVDHFYRQMRTVFNALVALPLIAFIVLYLELKTGQIQVLKLDDFSPLHHFSFAFGIVFLLAAEFIFQKSVGRITKEMPLQHKLTDYLSIFKTRAFLGELSMICMLIGLYTTYNQLFVIFFFVAFAYLSLTMPGDAKLSKHLKFSRDDITLMEARDAFDDEEEED